MWDDARARSALREVFDAAVAAAAPGAAVRRHLPDRPRGRCVVVGAGKAAAAMAAAVDAAWPDVELSGAVVTRYGQTAPAGRIAVLEAAHPVPDAASEQAARRMLELVRGLGPDDLVLALISGGGSALLALPAEGVTLAEKQAVNRALLASGATIAEINVVRKHLSAIKGGRLGAAAAPARIVSLLVSDVPGDDPALIASGPTVPDATTRADAAAIAARYAIDLPPAAAAVLARPGEAQVRVAGEVRLVATPGQALAAAAARAERLGLRPVIVGDAIEGESRKVAEEMAEIAIAANRQASSLLLSGGETSVTITGGRAGRGGRNTEFALALALALGRAPGIWALAADSDGIDGNCDAAGGIVAPDTLARAAALGLDARLTLAAHDSCSLFAALGDLVVTGATGTNVNDIRAVLVAS